MSHFNRSSSGRIAVALFGKHPGWADYFKLGLSTEALHQAHARFHVNGMLKLLQRTGDTTFLTRSEAISPPNLDHYFIWRDRNEIVAGRFWDSTDADSYAGRRAYPMFACADCSGLSFDWAAHEALGALEDLRSMAVRLAQTTAASSSAASAGPATTRKVSDTVSSSGHLADAAAAETVEAARKRAEETLQQVASSRAASEPVAGLDAGSRARLVANPALGANSELLANVLYALSQRMFAYAPGKLRGAKDTLPQRLRVPVPADSPGQAFEFWNDLVVSQLDPQTPILMIMPAKMGWLDIIAGQPTSDDLRCLQVDAAAEPPLSASVNPLPEDFAALAAGIIAAFKENKAFDSVFGSKSRAPSISRTPGKGRPTRKVLALAAAACLGLAVVALVWFSQRNHAPPMREPNKETTPAPSKAATQAPAPPELTSQPANRTVSEGSPVTFQITATGKPAPACQWFRDGQSVAVASGPLLELRAATTNDGGSYWAVVSNAAGVVTSAVAVLTVKPKVVAPSIIRQPSSRTAREGETVLIQVEAVGTPPPSYQWLHEGIAVPTFTSSALRLAGAGLDDSGAYSVIVSNSAGVLTSIPAILSVLAAPVIKAQPRDQSVAGGAPALFSVDAAGAPLDFQWFWNGTADAGATTRTLTVSGARLQDGGSCFVVVSNALGTARSRTALLLAAPSIVEPVAPTNLTLHPGDELKLLVRARGSTPLQYQWIRDDQPCAGGTDLTYMLDSVAPDSAGLYSVIVSNSAGRATAKVAQVQIAEAGGAGPVQIVEQSPSDFRQTVLKGQTVKLAIRAKGAPPISYRWLKDDHTVPGQTNEVLVLPNAQPTDSGNYEVNVINPAGKTTFSWNVIVKPVLSRAGQ